MLLLQNFKRPYLVAGASSDCNNFISGICNKPSISGGVHNYGPFGNVAKSNLLFMTTC